MFYVFPSSDIKKINFFVINLPFSGTEHVYKLYVYVWLTFQMGTLYAWQGWRSALKLLFVKLF